MPVKTKKLKKQLEAGRDKTKPQLVYVGSGSTRVNLECSGTPDGAFAQGSVVILAGDSDAGKTWMGQTTLAEASIDPNFDDYRLIYADIEHGQMMNIKRFFGKRLWKRIEVIYPEYVEDLYDLIDDMIKRKEKFIIVVDSENALHSRKDEAHENKNKNARKAGREEAGSYGTEKPRVHSKRLRVVASRLPRQGSILVIIAQLRDNLGMGAMYNPQKMTGGHALKYYSHLRLWLTNRGAIKKKVGVGNKKKLKDMGNLTEVKIKRNRYTGRKGSTDMSIYHSFGIDDVGDCVDYLTSEGYWKKKSGVIQATELDFSSKREKLIRHIVDEELEDNVRRIVGRVWKSIQKQLKIRRRSRYD